MFITLRLIRVIALIIAWWQAIALLPLITWIGNPVTTEMVVSLILKLVFMVLFFGLAFGLKKLTNFLHIRKHQTPYPPFTVVDSD